MRQIAPFLAAAALAACASTPPAPDRTTPPRREAPRSPQPPAPEGPPVRLAPVRFSDLPGWDASDHGPALEAFRRSCASVLRRPPGDPLGRVSAYGGTVGEWRAACEEAARAADPRAFFEANFIPHEVSAPASAMRRLTGYYEPVIEARYAPEPGFEEPFLPRPADLVSIDLTRFDETNALSDTLARDVASGLPPELAAARDEIEAAVDERLERRFRTPLWGRLTEDWRIAPYASRAELDRAAGALAYARPCDVYDVQVQGSARVRFPDGRDMRMAYSAQNGWAWKSIYGQLRDQGAIPAPTKANVCAYLAAQPPEAVRAALNLDPSYVFFSLEPIGDPLAGPKGAQGIALTALGSMAVDPAIHPYGAPIFVAPEAGPLAPRLLVAQDTGGAIRRGALRGDVFFGTGDEAGALALQMNAPARFWTLLPRVSSPAVAEAEGAAPAG